MNAAVITAFGDSCPTARAFHMSGKREVESAMRFRRAGIPMGVPGLDEWKLHRTDARAVAEARAALDGLRNTAL